MWLLYTHKKEKRNEKRRIWSHRNHNIIVCPFCFNPPLTLIKGSDLFFIFSFSLFLFFPFSGTHQEKGDIDSENWIIFHKELLAELHSLVTPKNHKKKKKGGPPKYNCIKILHHYCFFFTDTEIESYK